MIIGIAGNINSGKDTVASMLNYIHVVGKHKANYADWLLKQKAYDSSYSNRIHHFANVIKDNLSDILHLNRDIFDNRQFKDIEWYHISTGKFIKEKDLKDNHIKFELNNPIELLQEDNVVVKIRTIIQLYAEHIKLLFGENIWIKSSINRFKFINNLFGYCLIPDVRFFNELKAIWQANGIVIKIEREDNEIKSNHCSENNNLPCNYTIENNGTLPQLFFKVLAIYEQIKN